MSCILHLAVPYAARVNKVQVRPCTPPNPPAAKYKSLHNHTYHPNHSVLVVAPARHILQAGELSRAPRPLYIT